jgi:hypothetical protein
MYDDEYGERFNQRLEYSHTRLYFKGHIHRVRMFSHVRPWQQSQTLETKRIDFIDRYKYV